MKKIPLVDLQKQHRLLMGELRPALEAVLEKCDFIQGAAVREFEARFAELCGAGHAVGVSSGTSALSIALEAMGVGPGDEVVTQANTFFATAEAILHAGARPVFTDVDPGTGQMDPAGLERAIGPRTRAVVPVHMFGHPAPMEEVLQIADSREIPVLEDACQAHGARLDGRPIGSFGRAAAFSFYPGKNLGALGDAGAIVTGDAELAGRARLLSDHGSPKKYRHTLVGYNHRMDTLQAAALLVKLPRLAAWNEARRRAAERYGKALADCPRIAPLETAPGAEAVFHLYVCRARERDGLTAFLNERGIGAGIHYPVPCPMHPALASFGYREADYPNAVAAAREIVSLPLFPEIEDDDIEAVAAAVREFYDRGKPSSHSK